MKSDNVLLVVAIVAFLVAAFGFFTTYYSIAGFKITGLATEDATVNVTVTDQTSVNFTTDNIDFGSGSVDIGQSYAVLVSNGTVNDGNWPGTSNGFVLENIGNTNVSLNISAGKDASTFIAGTDPEYKFKVNDASGEDGACDFAGGITADTLYDLSSSQTSICSEFGREAGNDEIRIDLHLKIPSDSSTGALGDVITIHYEAI